MARNLVLVTFGVLVGVLGGAAIGIRAADEGGDNVMGDVEASEDSGVSASPTPAPAPIVRAVWDRLAQCESSGNWHSASNPIYKGGLQFDASTWARYGGLAFAWRADFATREQQVIVAERTLAVQGWQAWPNCSRRLGLR